MKDEYLDRVSKPDYLARENQLEADRLREQAKDLERKADILNISKAERNRMYAEASQIRACADRRVAR